MPMLFARMPVGVLVWRMVFSLSMSLSVMAMGV